MKIILVIAAILVVLVAANLIYKHYASDQPKPADKKEMSELAEDFRKMQAPPGAFEVKRKPVELLAKYEEAAEKKVEFCRKNVDRMLSKGSNLDVLEMRRLGKVINTRYLEEYFRCKAWEDISPVWCEPLKLLEQDMPYRQCQKFYQYGVFMRYLMIDSKNRMSIDELDRLLMNRDDPFREDIIKNIRLILSEDIADCEKTDLRLLTRLHCVLFKTGELPECEDEDVREELEHYASLAAPLMKAIRQNKPELVYDFPGEDSLLPWVGLFSEEPFCDSVYRQYLNMQCQQY